MHCGSAPPIDCIEPDFTVSGAAQWDRRLSNRERAEVLFVPLAENFGRAAIPQNGANPKWPLANYSPVYLSNFMVKEWDETSWYDQVSDYFAHHGFETRMIYFHTLDTEHLETQRPTSLIDALVYFCTVHEAERVIYRCHRRLHYGHRLNVLPGRTPLYLANERSVRLVRDLPDAVEKSETSLENELTPFGPVEFVTRQDRNSFLMEFVSSDSMVKALSSQNSWKPIELDGQFQKQRFVEEDVKGGICWAIESQPGFLEQRPRPAVSQYFDDRIQPIVETGWAAYQLPKPSPQKSIRAVQLKQLWKQKKKSVAFHKLSKRQKEKLYKEMCKEVGYGKPLGKVVSKALQKDVLKSVNWFLRTRDKPTMTKSTMAENLKLRKAVLDVIHEANEKGLLNLK